MLRLSRRALLRLTVRAGVAAGLATLTPRLADRALAHSAPASAASSRVHLAQEQIDAYVQERMAAWSVPGLALAIVDGGQVTLTRGYGLVFGACERKAMAMALVDRSLRAEELGEAVTSPAQMQEFVLSHSDNVEASGFVQHLKLPHYVDFQSELELVRKLRARYFGSGGESGSGA